MIGKVPRAYYILDYLLRRYGLQNVIKIEEANVQFSIGWTNTLQIADIDLCKEALTEKLQLPASVCIRHARIRKLAVVVRVAAFSWDSIYTYATVEGLEIKLGRSEKSKNPRSGGTTSSDTVEPSAAPPDLSTLPELQKEILEVVPTADDEPEPVPLSERVQALVDRVSISIKDVHLLFDADVLPADRAAVLGTFYDGDVQAMLSVRIDQIELSRLAEKPESHKPNVGIDPSFQLACTGGSVSIRSDYRYIPPPVQDDEAALSDLDQDGQSGLKTPTPPDYMNASVASTEFHDALDSNDDGSDGRSVSSQPGQHTENDDAGEAGSASQSPMDNHGNYFSSGGIPGGLFMAEPLELSQDDLDEQASGLDSAKTIVPTGPDVSMVQMGVPAGLIEREVFRFDNMLASVPASILSAHTQHPSRQGEAVEIDIDGIHGAIDLENGRVLEGILRMVSAVLPSQEQDGDDAVKPDNRAKPKPPGPAIPVKIGVKQMTVVWVESLMETLQHILDDESRVGEIAAIRVNGTAVDADLSATPSIKADFNTVTVESKRKRIIYFNSDESLNEIRLRKEWRRLASLGQKAEVRRRTHDTAKIDITATVTTDGQTKVDVKTLPVVVNGEIDALVKLVGRLVEAAADCDNARQPPAIVLPSPTLVEQLVEEPAEEADVLADSTTSLSPSRGSVDLSLSVGPIIPVEPAEPAPQPVPGIDGPSVAFSASLEGLNVRARGNFGIWEVISSPVQVDSADGRLSVGIDRLETYVDRKARQDKPALLIELDDILVTLDSTINGRTDGIEAIATLIELKPDEEAPAVATIGSSLDVQFNRTRVVFVDAVQFIGVFNQLVVDAAPLGQAAVLIPQTDGPGMTVSVTVGEAALEIGKIGDAQMSFTGRNVSAATVVGEHAKSAVRVANIDLTWGDVVLIEDGEYQKKASRPHLWAVISDDALVQLSGITVEYSYPMFARLQEVVESTLAQVLPPPTMTLPDGTTRPVEFADQLPGVASAAPLARPATPPVVVPASTSSGKNNKGKEPAVAVRSHDGRRRNRPRPPNVEFEDGDEQFAVVIYGQDDVRSKKGSKTAGPDEPTDKIGQKKAPTFDVLLFNVGVGVECRDSPAKAVVLFEQASFHNTLRTADQPDEHFVKADLKVESAVVGVIDDVSRIKKNVKFRSRDVNSTLSRRRFVEICDVNISSAKITVSSDKKAELDVTGMKVVLSTCADSLKTLILILGQVGPPSKLDQDKLFDYLDVESDEEDMNEFGGVPGARPGHFDQVVNDDKSDLISIAKERIMTVESNDPTNPDRDYVFESMPEPVGSVGQSAILAAKKSGRSVWEPTKRKEMDKLFDQANVSLRVRVRVRDCDVAVNIFRGYDWPSTRRARRDEAKKIRPAKNGGESGTIKTEEVSERDSNSAWTVVSDQAGEGQAKHKNNDDDDSEEDDEPDKTAEDDVVLLRRKQCWDVSVIATTINADVGVFVPGISEKMVVANVRVRDVVIKDEVAESKYTHFLELNETGSHMRTQKPMVEIGFELVNRHKDEQQDGDVRLKIIIQPIRLCVHGDTLDFLSAFGKFEPPGTIVTAPSTTPRFEHVEVNEVDLLLDYWPNNVDFNKLFKGKVDEVAKLTKLSQAEIKLQKRLLYGVDGTDRLQKLLNEMWTANIVKTQIGAILLSVGAIRMFTSIGGALSNVVTETNRHYLMTGRPVQSAAKGARKTLIETTTSLVRGVYNVSGGVLSAFESAHGFVEAGSGHPPSDWSSSSSRNPRTQPHTFQMGLGRAFQTISSGFKSTRKIVTTQLPEDMNNKGAVKAIVQNGSLVALQPPIALLRGLQQVFYGLNNHINPEDLKRRRKMYR